MYGSRRQETYDTNSKANQTCPNSTKLFTWTVLFAAIRYFCQSKTKPCLFTRTPVHKQTWNGPNILQPMEITSWKSTNRVEGSCWQEIMLLVCIVRGIEAWYSCNIDIHGDCTSQMAHAPIALWGLGGFSPFFEPWSLSSFSHVSHKPVYCKGVSQEGSQDFLVQRNQQFNDYQAFARKETYLLWFGDDIGDRSRDC